MPEPVADQRYAEYYRAYGYAYPYTRSTFPIHTLAGAGIGAIIGHQSDHEAQGAWIGAGVGLLFDVFN